jgi:hypothetical protein
MTNTISAAANPALANDLINKALASTQEPEGDVNILFPMDTVVNLPGGYLTTAGEVITQVEVRELNGNDEEAIARAANVGRAILTVLQRGTVKVGDQKVDDNLLDNLLSGDRDAIILGIIKTTFGRIAELKAYCSGCDEVKDVAIDLDEDIKTTVLADPINDRVFTVKGKKNVYTVQLPTGSTQKELLLNQEKTSAELNTILLEGTILKINESPVLSKIQVQQLGMVDRKLISTEITKRVVGPKFDDVVVTCPDCEGEVLVPVNFGTLFRF